VARSRQPSPQPKEAPPQGLEEELLEAKARLQKVEGDLDEGLKRVLSIDGDVRRLSEILSASGVTRAALPGLKEELRQVRDQFERVKDRQTELANRMDEMSRQSQVGVGRERQELAAVTMQLQAQASDIAQFPGHVRALEEASRRVKDDLAGLRLEHQGLSQDVQEISTTGARAMEGTVRLEQELGRAAARIDGITNEDKALSERLSLFQEQSRRQGERLDRFEAAAALAEEAREQLEVAAFERGKILERLAAVERACEELAEQVHEFLQGLALVDQRGQSQATQMLQVEEQLRELNDDTKGLVKRLSQVTLRQRRRQAEALAQEIKELSQGEVISEG
jgi:chromosome segregation ATPase